jgi:hypothetical protein
VGSEAFVHPEDVLSPLLVPGVWDDGLNAAVSTGFFQRFGLGRRLGRYWRFVHVSVTMSFYFIILVHVLHGLGII